MQRNTRAVAVELEPSKVLDRSDILFGYEIEAEGYRFGLGLAEDAVFARSGFGIIGDGSLRGLNAREFVSLPMGGKAAVHRLRVLCRQLNTQDDVFTHRCSTHIHMNMLELPVGTLPSMVLLTILCDNMMFVAGGADRNVNYNSRPISLVAEEVDALGRWAADPAMVGLNIPKDCRYMGTNWQSMSKFGTVEFRHFPGCSHAKSLIFWTNLLCRMYSAAEESTVDELMEVCHGGAGALGHKVFGGLYPQLTSKTAEPDWAETMETAETFVNAMRAPMHADRKTLHGFLEAEYII